MCYKYLTLLNEYIYVYSFIVTLQDKVDFKGLLIFK